MELEEILRKYMNGEKLSLEEAKFISDEIKEDKASVYFDYFMFDIHRTIINAGLLVATAIICMALIKIIIDSFFGLPVNSSVTIIFLLAGYGDALCWILTEGQYKKKINQLEEYVNNIISTSAKTKPKKIKLVKTLERVDKFVKNNSIIMDKVLEAKYPGYEKDVESLVNLSAEYVTTKKFLMTEEDEEVFRYNPSLLKKATILYDAIEKKLSSSMDVNINIDYLRKLLERLEKEGIQVDIKPSEFGKDPTYEASLQVIQSDGTVIKADESGVDSFNYFTNASEDLPRQRKRVKHSSKDDSLKK